MVARRARTCNRCGVAIPDRPPGSCVSHSRRLQVPQARDPVKVLPPLPFWALYAGYLWFAMLSPDSPGDPAFQTSWETVMTVLHESANFAFVNVAANAAGFPLLPDVPENPVSEATFNFVALWGLCFLPLMLTDPRCPRRVPTVPLWAGSWFLTNVVSAKAVEPPEGGFVVSDQSY